MGHTAWFILIDAWNLISHWLLMGQSGTVKGLDVARGPCNAQMWYKWLAPWCKCWLNYVYQFICVAECTAKVLLGLLNSYLDGVKKGDFYQKKQIGIFITFIIFSFLLVIKTLRILVIWILLEGLLWCACCFCEYYEYLVVVLIIWARQPQITFKM